MASKPSFLFAAGSPALDHHLSTSDQALDFRFSWEHGSQVPKMLGTAILPKIWPLISHLSQTPIR